MGVTKCCSEIPSVSYIWIMVFALSCSLSLSIAVPGRNKQHTKMMASHMTLRDNTRKMMASHMTLRDNTPNNNASIKGFNSIINHILGIQTPTFRPSKIWLAPLWRYASRAPNSHVFWMPGWFLLGLWVWLKTGEWIEWTDQHCHLGRLRDRDVSKTFKN